MFITGKHLSRRTALKGMGVTIALPFLEAMVPVAGAAARARRRTCGWWRSRWCTGPPAALSSASRKTCGRRRRSAATSTLPTSLKPLEPFRNDITIVSNTDVRNAEAFTAGDRRRSLPLERGVPDAVAPEADAGLRRLRRHVARSDLRAADTARTRRFRRCSCASRTSTRPAAAPTATPAPTPTRSAGRRRRSRCR